MQERYREATLQRIEKKLVLECLGQKIDHFRKVASETKISLNEASFQFGSEIFPVSVWEARYNLNLIYYAKMRTVENQLYANLFRYKMTEQQIIELLEKGKYLKSPPTENEESQDLNIQEAD